MRTITGTVNAFITNKWITPASLMDCEPCEALGQIAFYPETIDGWTQCGTAEITVTLLDDNSFLENMVGVLKAEKQKTLADAQVKANQIDERIQSLLALPAPVQT